MKVKASLLEYFKRLEGNSKICTALFPLWAIPYTIYMYYLSLYFKAMGFSSVQIGNLMIAANVSAMFFSIFAGTIVNFLGRKKSTFIFDFLSSSVPPLLFLLFPQNNIAILGMALTGLNRIMSVGYYLLLVEDRGVDNSVVSMNLFNAILLVSGIFIPLAGLIVHQNGILFSQRIFLLIAVISMTILNFVRNFFVKETETGEKIKNEKERSSLFKDYKQALVIILKNSQTRSAILINSLIYTYFATATTSSLFFAPYFTEYLGLSELKFSYIGGIYTVGIIVALVFVNPRLSQSNLMDYSIRFSLVSIVGFIMILKIFDSLVLILLGVFAVALSYGVLKTIGDSVMAICPGGKVKTTIYSMSFLISSIITIVTIKLVTILYQYSPCFLFIISSFIIFFVMIISLQERRNVNG